MQGSTASETLANFSENGAVELYHDNVKTFQTDSDGITVLGPEGGNATLRLSADEGDDNADLWKLQVKAAGGIQLENYASGSWEENIVAYGNGAVELYHDNFKSFSTNSNGIFVYAPEGSNADIHLQADEGDDNADKWRIRAGVSGTFIVGNYSTGSWVDNLTVDGSGRVGIGTTSPTEELTISSATPAIKLEDTDQANSYTQISNANQDLYFSANGASAHANFIFRSGNAGTFAERMRIDSSGRLLLGTTTEGNDDADDLTIATSGRTGITIRSADDEYGNIFFSDGTSGADEYRGSIQYYHSNNSLILKSNAVDALTIDSSQNATFAGEVSDSIGNLRAIPQNSKSSAYQIVDSDAGKHIYISSGGVTIPSGWGSTGDAFTVINNSASDQTITCSAVTVYLAGDNTAKTSLTLATRGVCTFLKTAGNLFYVSGAGLS